MEAKTFEIRDVATTIMVVAYPTRSDDEAESYAFRRCGFGRDSDFIMVTQIGSMSTRYNRHSWEEGYRTMKVAHGYIADNWDKLESGDVIDVEVILGEKDTPKISERLTSRAEKFE